MAVYGQNLYGTTTYGYTIPVPYTVDPFVAAPIDYNSIQLTWSQPNGPIYGWRIVRNMSNFPANQDDGALMMTDAIPGGRGVLNSNPYLDNGSSTGWSSNNGTLSLVSGATLPPSAKYLNALKYVNGGTTVGGITESASLFTAAVNTNYIASILVYSTVTTVYLGFDWYNGSTFVSSGLQECLVTPYTWTLLTVTITSPSSGINNAALRANPALGGTIYTQQMFALSSVPITLNSRAYVDTSPSPGQYHYYAMFLKTSASTNTWVNAGIAGCLMPVNYGSGPTMMNLIPGFYIQNADNENELQADPTGNLFLEAFMNVFGWALDYLRTQYDTYLNLNSATNVPFNDLYLLAAELNVPIYPGIPGNIIRKAVRNNAVINKQRGTLEGIQAQVSAYSGWELDVTTGPNLMLSDDQSWFAHPYYPAWSPYIAYQVGEKVSYTSGSNSYFYSCIATGNYGVSPSGTSSPNTYWSPILSVLDSTTLGNSNTGGISTWEAIYSTSQYSVPAAGTLEEIDGIQDPVTSTNYAFNGLRVANKSGSTQAMDIRLIARTLAEISNTATLFPDAQRVIGDAIPITYYGFSPQWNSTTSYEPGNTVVYNNMPFVALRASIGSTPTFAVVTATSDWAPAGMDIRGRIAPSAYMQASTAITPQQYMDWFDASGNYITTVYANNVNSGTPGLDTNIVMDSFVANSPGTLASSRPTDDCGHTWTTALGSFDLSAFGTGCAYPASATTRSIATTTMANATCTVGLTFVTNPPAGYVTALALRYSSSTSYLRADMTTLKENNGGTITTIGTYSTPFSAGDRMLVELNGSAITVYRNGISVLTATTSFNSTVTTHGIIYETQ